MQIHELNQRQQVNEVDLVGPNSIFNVGKQVLKNPAALGKSSALGAAQQASAQTSAQQSADTLTKQGYKVGGSIKPTVTTKQQLQAVKSSAAVQQQIKNLTSQWIAQSAALKKAKPVTEAVAQFNPRDLTDPKFASVLRAIQAQDAARQPAPTGAPGKDMPMQPYQVPGAGTSATPATATGYQTPAKAAVDAKVDLEKQLTMFKTQFKTWSDPRLQAGGITIDEVRKTPETQQMLDSALSNIAVAMRSGDENLEKQAVEEYFNIAIAAIQAHNQNTEQTPVVGSAAATAARAASGQTADEEQQILQQLERAGISKSTLGTLGNLMMQSARGNSTINNTGNPLLNAIAKLAGMTIR